MIDVDKLRAETPGADNAVHLNNAGSSLMPRPVIDTIQDYFDHEVMHGGYETFGTYENDINEVYGSIASLVNASPEEIAIADCATRGWDMALYSMDLSDGDRILTTTTEYISNWAAYLHLRDSKGVVVEVVPDTPSDEIDVEALEQMLDETVKLISINHVPTHSGLINPAADVGRVANEYGIPYLLDACQSVGQLPIDVREIGCDMMSVTSRKFLRGPRGEGFLYVREEYIEELSPAFVELHNTTVVLPDRYELRTDARRFETWEKNFANVLGMGAAADYAMEVGVADIWERIQLLASAARDALGSMEGVEVLDRGVVLGGIVGFAVDGRPAQLMKELLGERGIHVSISTKTSSPIDMHNRDIDSLVRASFHAYNTEEELEDLLEAVHVLS
ncbi:MAG: aminotransferase class V-fold PLP-dependent enzyme [Acidimicrobiia bacterium]